MSAGVLQAVFLVAMVVLCVRRRMTRLNESFSWIYYLFFFSGFPALIYQIVWERGLFTIYGVNVESVTIVVTGFMLGLGLGSLLGGRLSRIARAPLLTLFGAAELCIATFGLGSLRLFHWAALYTAGTSLAGTALISFALLLIPTMLMGSTLPLLVEYAVRRSHNVGRSLGMLYFVNALGSAAACFMAAGFTMRTLGESGSVRLAALVNVAVGLTVLIRHLRDGESEDSLQEHVTVAATAAGPAEGLSIATAAAFVAIAGFISLAYEIIWYRLFSFWSGSNARVFATLLGAYLAGIAVGGLVAHDVASGLDRKRSSSECLRLVAGFVVIANLIGFAVGPAMGFAPAFQEFSPALLLPAIAAALLGAVFPLICHLSVSANSETGSGMSFLYFSNILGSALGSFLVGFVIMNLWGVREISVMLALMGVGLAVALLFASNSSRSQMAASLAAVAVASAGVIVLAHPMFSRLYERLLQYYDSRIPFAHLVENRSGVIAVSRDGSVFGGGIYDGVFNVDPVRDVNGLIRIYALSSFHGEPRRVLTIGLASGSWAQILANHPQVQEEVVVEINPGYLGLISQYPQVASLLSNPKVKIVTDDGRRWLLANPEQKFDAIVMNTTFNWREHISNLLSVEFLQIARRHLRSGGVIFYNTTASPEALLTGATVFPYALRVVNFLAVSDHPIEVDSGRLERILREYRIDGKPVLDLRKPEDLAALNQIIAMTQRFNDVIDFKEPSMEYADSIRARFRGARIIADDNMGTEWMH